MSDAFVSWQPMYTAPTDGTVIRLLVKFEHSSPDDNSDVAATIGAMSMDYYGNPQWAVVGWDWSQDCWRSAPGTAMGWMHLCNDLVPPIPIKED